jgi:hypothetical protein
MQMSLKSDTMIFLTNPVSADLLESPLQRCNSLLLYQHVFKGAVSEALVLKARSTKLTYKSSEQLLIGAHPAYECYVTYETIYSYRLCLLIHRISACSAATTCCCTSMCL